MAHDGNYLIRQATLNQSKREPSINPDDFSQWTVLEYLLSPVSKALQEAGREK
jgi:hypothetical protein